jgi:PKD repeat protein
MRRLIAGCIFLLVGVRAVFVVVFLTALMSIGANAASATWYDTYDFSSQGVVAYWPFDRDAIDKSRNGNTGSWSGGGFAPAVLGQGYQFSSGVSYSVPGTVGRGLHHFTALTMAAWFKLTSDPFDNESLLGVGLDGQPGHLFLFIFDSFGGTDSRNAVGLNAVTNRNAPISAPPAEIPNSLGQWHHLAVTWDGTVTMTYVDGVLVAASTTPGGSALAIPVSHPFYINRHDWVSGASSRLSGVIDEVVVAQRALSAAEIAALATDANADGIADFWGVASAPSADFSWSPANPVTGQLVQFTDRSTQSPTSWLWSFGDGTTSTVQNPAHIYAVPGTFAVTLQACSADGCDTKTQTLVVAPSTSVNASFTWTPRPAIAGQQVQFTDTSTGNPTSWSWSFGDGATSTARNPQVASPQRHFPSSNPGNSHLPACLSLDVGTSHGSSPSASNHPPSSPPASRCLLTRA